jgi:hypothetical protein
MSPGAAAGQHEHHRSEYRTVLDRRCSTPLRRGVNCGINSWASADKLIGHHVSGQRTYHGDDHDMASIAAM